MTEHSRAPHQIQERPLSALNAIFMRRSVRAYTPQKLDETTIRSLLDAATQAPTAMHTKPWAFGEGALNRGRAFGPMPNTGQTRANSDDDDVVINLSAWTNAMILVLVVSGLYAAFVVGAMTLGTLVWLEAVALILGLAALASARGSGPSIRSGRLPNDRHGGESSRRHRGDDGHSHEASR